jgi:hypothetical protein
MNTPEKITSMLIAACPHCGEEMLVDIATSVPSVRGAYSADQMDKAKAEFIEKVSAIPLPIEVIKGFISQVEESGISPADVDSMIENIKQNQNVISKEA